MRAWSSALMPMPVSTTVKVKLPGAAGSTWTLTRPEEVNLRALPIRLERICLANGQDR